MPKISDILEEKEVLEYLEARNLTKQYDKAKKYLLMGLSTKVRFKLRNPKKDEVWYFRINSQYRAFGYFNENDELIIFEINNHQ